LDGRVEILVKKLMQFASTDKAGVGANVAGHFLPKQGF
jgi:hypothetical protein